jgi:hypothetical protein
MHAQSAALCTVLACHLSRIQALVPMAFVSDANNDLYKGTLRVLESAALQAKDSVFDSKVGICRELYAELTGGG